MDPQGLVMVSATFGPVRTSDAMVIAAAQLPTSGRLKICLYKADGEQPSWGHAMLGSVIHAEKRLHNLASTNFSHPIKKNPQSPQARDAGKVER